MLPSRAQMLVVVGAARARGLAVVPRAPVIRVEQLAALAETGVFEVERVGYWKPLEMVAARHSQPAVRRLFVRFGLSVPAAEARLGSVVDPDRLIQVLPLVLAAWGYYNRTPLTL